MTENTPRVSPYCEELKEVMSETCRTVRVLPDGVPVVADDAAVICASAAVEGEAAHRENQLPVWTHDGHWATV